MAKKKRRSIDKVRASREGHEYHEAWTARKAMQLLWSDSDLRLSRLKGHLQPIRLALLLKP